jgi:peptidoglycan/LPS O-acetylase OafA/YrhL
MSRWFDRTLVMFNLTDSLYSRGQFQPAPWREDPRKRLAAVEGLRGLAMTLVFFGHFTTVFGHYAAPETLCWKILDYFSVWGHRGIAFFFVITGYFVYGKFLTKDYSYLPFVKRRLLRICCVYWSAIALWLALSALLPAESKLPHGFEACAIYILLNLILLQGFLHNPLITVSWAITYLVLAYLTLPLFVRVLRMRHWYRWQRICAIVLASLICLKLCDLYPLLNSRVVLIPAGMLLWEALGTESFVRRFSPTGEIAAAILLMLGLTLRYLFERHRLTFLPDLHLPGLYQHLFVAVGVFYFSAYVFAYRGFLTRWLSGRTFTSIGKVSYSFYLLHGLALKAMLLFTGVIFSAAMYSPALVWGILPLCYAASLCVSGLFYKLIEEPLASWTNRRFGSSRSAALPEFSANPAVPSLAASLFRFSRKWRKRSPTKITERTHEVAREALYAGRESRHPEAASVGAGSDLRITAKAAADSSPTG